MKNKVKKNVTIATRISEGMQSELSYLATKNKKSVSEVVRFAVSEFVSKK